MSSTARSIREAVEIALPSLVYQYTRAPDDKQNIAPMVLGPPSLGKTGVLSSIARKLGISKLVVIACGTIDAKLEFCGLPENLRVKLPRKRGSYLSLHLWDNSKGQFSLLDTGDVSLITKWITPDRIAIFKDLPSNEKGLLVFDDMHLLPTQDQAMIMQLLTDGMRIHTHQIGSGNNVALMLTGNRAQDKAAASVNLQPVINRVHVIEIEPDKRLLAQHWLADFANPTGVNPAIQAHISKKAEDIYNFEPDDYGTDDDEITPFASSRSWTNLSRLLDLLEKFKRGETREISDLFPYAEADFEEILKTSAVTCLSDLTNFAAGIVGTKTASNFVASYELYNQFDIERLLKTHDFSEIKNHELSIFTQKAGRFLSDRLIEMQREFIWKRYGGDKLVKSGLERDEAVERVRSEETSEVLTYLQIVDEVLERFTFYQQVEDFEEKYGEPMVVIVQGLRGNFPEKVKEKFKEELPDIIEELDKALKEEAKRDKTEFLVPITSIFQLAEAEVFRKNQKMTIDNILKTESIKKFLYKYPEEIVDEILNYFRFSEDLFRFISKNHPDKKTFCISSFFGAITSGIRFKSESDETFGLLDPDDLLQVFHSFSLGLDKDLASSLDRQLYFTNKDIEELVKKSSKKSR